MCLQTDPKMRLGCKEILELEWVKGMLYKFNIQDVQQ
jgi:hypothetical protein